MKLVYLHFYFLLLDKKTTKIKFVNKLRLIFLQETSFDSAGIENLKEKVLQVLKQIHKEKDEEMVKVDMWCHFGHAYVTKVDEGETSFH